MDISVPAYSRQQGTLGISYGDGSGSGTGGTIQVGDHHGECPTMEAWMGTWTARVHSFSSNWKELRTLVHTLEREIGGKGLLRNSTLFYFTDNLVTYYIVTSGSSSSPELQKLLRRLKYLELLLEIRLEVVHVPGKHMIAQRTDGLSRGIRIGSGLPLRAPQQETLRMFQPVAPMPPAIAWMTHQARPFSAHIRLKWMQGDAAAWTFGEVKGQGTLWLPAPEWAHQVIDMVVNAWIEYTWDKEAFFLIPRVFQWDWGRMSKHVVELGTHPAASHDSGIRK